MAVTPPTPEDAQKALEHSRRLREESERAAEQARARWPEVRQVVGSLLREEEENHLAARVRLALGLGS